MSRNFSITHAFTFKDNTVPTEFAFDIPINGSFEFILIDTEVFLYCEGILEDGLTKQYGRVFFEGDTIPDDYKTEAIFPIIFDEGETLWTIIALKVAEKKTSWRKTF